jgi:hypothetical protein
MPGAVPWDAVSISPEDRVRSDYWFSARAFAYAARTERQLYIVNVTESQTRFRCPPSRCRTDFCERGRFDPTIQRPEMESSSAGASYLAYFNAG